MDLNFDQKCNCFDNHSSQSLNCIGGSENATIIYNRMSRYSWDMAFRISTMADRVFFPVLFFKENLQVLGKIVPSGSLGTLGVLDLVIIC